MAKAGSENMKISEQADQLGRYWLEIAHRMLVRKLPEAISQELTSKLSSGQIRALVFLAESGELKIHELASVMSLDESTVTRLVDKLEANGVAERRRCESDRRSIGVAITESGQEVVARANEHRRAFMREVLAVLEPAERAEFLRLTGKAAETLRLRPAEAGSK